MSFIINPYAQAGWIQNAQEITNVGAAGSGYPPTFGALPAPQNSQKSFVTFQFSTFTREDFNCRVIGPENAVYFEIRTYSSGTTVISRKGEPFAGIRWTQYPTVQINGLFDDKLFTDFLKISPDKSCRTMVVNGKYFGWYRDNSVFHLFSIRPNNPPEEFARLKFHTNKIILDLTSDGFQAGLLEPSVISAIILFFS